MRCNGCEVRLSPAKRCCAARADGWHRQPRMRRRQRRMRRSAYNVVHEQLFRQVAISEHPGLLWLSALFSANGSTKLANSFDGTGAARIFTLPSVRLTPTPATERSFLKNLEHQSFFPPRAHTLRNGLQAQPHSRHTGRRPALRCPHRLTIREAATALCSTAALAATLTGTTRLLLITPARSARTPVPRTRALLREPHALHLRPMGQLSHLYMGALRMLIA